MMSHLVIVESPTKAKTIKKFLGKDYVVQASMGHVRDLPSSGLSVDVDGNFDPVYEVQEEKKSVISSLQKELKNAEAIWIATDEDREGEAIGWHLLEALKIKKDQKVHRIVFHEITKTAIDAAVASPRDLDMKLVEAQQARRILDRLVGYTLSPFLWKTVYRGLSAGRVQSVVVRIIVDREREIQAFDAVEYWTIDAELSKDTEEMFTAGLRQKDGKKFVPVSQEESDQVLKDIEGKEWSVSDIEEKELKKNPPAPFTTSTLQQEAGRKLGFSVKQTMVVAQQLYEGMSLGKGEETTGLITYMRTDSVNLSEKALADAKMTIEQLFGREYVLSSPRVYKTKSKGAQEAHEAIRPTEMSRTPASLQTVLDHQQLKLYTLIWNRTMATQMAAAELKRVGADITIAQYTFRATGQTVVFDGYYRAYTESTDASQDSHRKDDEEGSEQSGDKFLPQLSVGEKLKQEEILPEQHFTKPPPRYTEASLVKKLEDEGIGRPSTYAPTISTVQQRGYIRKEGKQLAPEDVAFTVTDLLVEHFTDIVDLKFTATMEDKLDDIAEGKEERVSFLKGFYGPFKALIDAKGKEVKKEDVLKEKVLGTDEKTGLSIVVLTGRFGPYIQVGTPADVKEGRIEGKPQSASLGTGMTKETVTLEDALALLSFPRNLGKKGDDDITVNRGRYGPYIKWGKITATIPEDIDPITVDMAQAEELIATAKDRKKKEAEPLKELGKDPNTKGEVLIKAGRYGPYITDGITNVSVPKRFEIADIDLVTACELLEKKRTAPPRKGGAWGAKAKAKPKPKPKAKK
ncbi:type I DNA topoisomerase [Candidatus Peregrinibacteria bacterium CG10_big_fil_rev_8_21_14_0_10_42_8]|nr:MAG: type I DNA topoisomerase [Candidatus Peregrinibacteria bacterium CG10_big_fil_rev_8_21_14_0_10_42_8]